MRIVILIVLAALSVNAQQFYNVGDTPAIINRSEATRLAWSSTALPVTNKSIDLSGTTLKKEEKKGPVQILTREQRIALTRITSKGFIVGQKTLKDGRKELTWTNGKDTVVTTQKVERILAKKSPDPRRAEIAAAKSERDTAKADRAAIKAERDALKIENDTLKKQKGSTK